MMKKLGNSRFARTAVLAAGLIGGAAAFTAAPAQADPRDWRGDRGEWRDRDWHRDRDDFRFRGYVAPYAYNYYAPGYAYAAPVYTPPPVVYPAVPSVNFVIPLHFR